MYREKTDEKLLEELLERGYGADERKKWRDRWLRNERAKRDLARRRSGRTVLSPEHPNRTPEQRPESTLDDEGVFQRRAQDSVKAISPRLRRRIDAYAYRNGYLATGVRERIRSLFTLLFPRIKDYTSRKLIKRMVVGRGFRSENPFNYCLADDLDAVYYTSRFLLGGSGGPRLTEWGFAESRDADGVRRAIAARDPFALEFLSRFSERDEMLLRSLEFIKLRFARGARIETASLVRVVKAVYRLLFSTGNLDPERLTGVYSAVIGVHRARYTGSREKNQIEEIMGLFQIAYNNLFEFKHQLFPALLKLMGTFFREDESLEGENRFKILEFLGLAEEDILILPEEEDREEPGKTEARAAESETADDWSDEPDEPEVEVSSERGGEAASDAALTEEKAPSVPPSFGDRFKRELSALKYLFPGSGIREMDGWPCFLPFFDLKVYNKDLTFSNLVQHVSRFDPMGQIMVLHRIVDNLLTSLEIFTLDEILAKRGELAAQLSDIIIEWQRIYSSLFDPYLKELSDYVHVSEGDKSFNLSPMMRRVEENLNQLKNMAIQHYGKVVFNVKDRVGYGEGVRLYKLVEELNDLLLDLADDMNLAGFREKKGGVARLWSEIAARRVVDYKTNAYKPAVGRVQKYIEAKYQAPIYRISARAQAEFFDVLVGLVNMYDFLLNDPDTYFHSSEGKVYMAGPEERETWQRVRESLSEITFRDEPRDTDYVLDPLTGLISKGYWDESLPEKQEELAGQSYSLIYARIDEMDWLKEKFPHRRYPDQLLKQAARTFLGHMKILSAGGVHMEAVRAEENGLLLLARDELKTAAPMAEDLRKAHKEQLKELAFYREIAELRKKGNKPCGTLSLGVAQYEKGETLKETVNRAKEAASEASAAGDRAMVYSVGVLVPCRDFIEQLP